MTKTRFYWDSCVFLHLLQHTKPHFSILRQLMEDGEAEKLSIVTSALTIAEVCKIDPNAKATTADLRNIERLFEETPFIVVRQLDRAVAKAAARIVRDYQIKPPDAIHIATAVDLKVSSFHTYDGMKSNRRKLLSFDGKIGRPPLRIEQPFRDPTLFDDLDE